MKIKQGSPHEQVALAHHITSLAVSPGDCNSIGELTELLVLLGATPTSLHDDPTIMVDPAILAQSCTETMEVSNTQALCHNLQPKSNRCSHFNTSYSHSSSKIDWLD